MTVSQAATAITQNPIVTRRTLPAIPSSVSQRARSPYSSAKPPANANRKNEPRRKPWISPHVSLLVKLISAPFSALALGDARYSDWKRTPQPPHTPILKVGNYVAASSTRNSGAGEAKPILAGRPAHVADGSGVLAAGRGPAYLRRPHRN